jgi:hypothetical protein
MLTPAERREIAKIHESLNTLSDRFDLHAQLVEMNSLLRTLIDSQGGMTPQDIAVVVARITAASTKLDRS